MPTTIAEIENWVSQAYAMSSMNDEYADKRAAWCHDPKHAQEEMWWGKPQPYYRFLYLVTKNHAGGMALEVGTHKGIGFSCLSAGAKASNNLKSWTVGLDLSNHGSCHEVAKQYPNCEFICGNSISKKTVAQVEKICKDNNIKIETIFIDATHKMDWVNAEVWSYKHLFSDNLVIIMDDCFVADNNTALPQCFAELPASWRKTYPGLHTDNCIGVALSSKEHFASWKPKLNPHQEGDDRPLLDIIREINA